MRPILATVLLLAVGCAGNTLSREEAERAPDFAPRAGQVVNVNPENSLVVVEIEDASGFRPGRAAVIETDRGGTGMAASAVLRIGSAGDGYLAGSLEAGSVAEGPCTVGPLSEEGARTLGAALGPVTGPR